MLPLLDAQAQTGPKRCMSCGPLRMRQLRRLLSADRRCSGQKARATMAATSTPTTTSASAATSAGCAPRLHPDGARGNADAALRALVAVAARCSPPRQPASAMGRGHAGADDRRTRRQGDHLHRNAPMRCGATTCLSQAPARRNRCAQGIRGARFSLRAASTTTPAPGPAAWPRRRATSASLPQLRGGAPSTVSIAACEAGGANGGGKLMKRHSEAGHEPGSAAAGRAAAAAARRRDAAPGHPGWSGWPEQLRVHPLPGRRPSRANPARWGMLIDTTRAPATAPTASTPVHRRGMHRPEAAHLVRSGSQRSS